MLDVPSAMWIWPEFNTGTLISIFIGMIFVGIYVPSLFVRLRHQTGQTLRHILLWFGIVTVIIIGYAFKTELAFMKNRVYGALLPGRAVEAGSGKIVINKNSDDEHFNLQALVNGQASHFMVDTGASDVVLNYESAKRLGFDLVESDFNRTVSTANGLTKVAEIKIAEMRIASITIKNVSASVSRGGELDVNLLGMSFLSRLRSYSVEGDRLTLQQ